MKKLLSILMLTPLLIFSQSKKLRNIYHDAVLYEVSGEYKKAIELYTKYISSIEKKYLNKSKKNVLHYKLILSYIYRGNAYYKTNKSSYAIDDLEYAIELTEVSEKYLLEKANYFLGKCNYSVKDYKKAIENFTIAINRYEDNTPISSLGFNNDLKIPKGVCYYYRSVAKKRLNMYFCGDLVKSCEKGLAESCNALMSCDSVNDLKYINIPDNNFEKYLIDMGYDDIMDGYVLVSNIDTIQFLDISDKLIKDLNGIEAFKSLSVLNCSRNWITYSFDLSKNKFLTELNCASNYMKIGLDLEKNHLLTKLNCSENSLSFLIINKNLKHIDCENAWGEGANNKCSNLKLEFDIE